jgi:nucleoside-diphosphate-sugar epimerase
MKSISIIGCGWLGMALGRHLCQLGLKVVGTTTSQSKLLFLKEMGITPFCYKLGSPVPVDLLNSDIVIINIPPRGNYIQELQRLRDEMKNDPWIIFISSTSVYKDTNGVVYEHDAVDTPSTHTGISLLHAENIFVQSALDTTVVRFAGLYGPNRHPGSFLAGKTNLKGAHNPINLIHLEDCIGITTKIIESNYRNEVFNACSDIHPSKAKFYTKATQLINLKLPEFSDEVSSFKIINSHKLKSILGYEFIHPDPMKTLKLI